MLNAVDSASPPTAVSQTSGRSPLLYAVVALTVLNCGFLIGLALFTSNPVVLNPDQIRKSSLVVTASLESSEQRGAALSIKKVWKGAAETDTVFVRDLSAAQLRGSDVWIFPLSPAVSSTDYVVTPRKHASAATKPLVYPADPDTLNKLKSLLSPDDSSL